MKVEEIDDLEYQEITSEERHKEIVSTLKKVSIAISSLPKEDAELKKLMSENRDAINNFAKAVEELKKQGKPEVKVETNQDKVVDAVTDFSQQIGEIMKGIDKRLTALENQPKPKKLRVTGRDAYGGAMNEITIEYK